MSAPPPPASGEPDTSNDPDLLLFIAKMFTGGVLGGLFGGISGAIDDLVAGGNWADSEDAAATINAQPDGTVPTPDHAPKDQCAGKSVGLIVKPASINATSIPEYRDGAIAWDWDVSDFVSGDRSYGFIIDRETQVWWPPRPAPDDSVKEIPGYIGRWGPLVTHDPKGRRGGMKCPDFALMFAEALGVYLEAIIGPHSGP